MSKVAVIDYGVGNLFSLNSALACVDADAVVTADPATIRSAASIVLPGVGAFGDAMDKLRASGLIEVLDERVAAGTPFLGICLGMQLLFERSFEYGEHRGLGYLPGEVVSLAAAFEERALDLKVPHMGWNQLEFVQPGDPLLAATPQASFVYFVHSFYADKCADSLIATAEYGISVPAVVGRENVYGCQFHPEKSGAVGLDLLRTFLAL